MQQIYLCSGRPPGSVQPSAAAGAREPSHLHDVMQRRQPVCRQRRRGEERRPVPLRLLPAGQRGGTKSSPPRARHLNDRHTLESLTVNHSGLLSPVIAPRTARLHSVTCRRASNATK